MPDSEAFYAISRFVVKLLDVLSGPESSTTEKAISLALENPLWPEKILRAKEDRTVNRPFVLSEGLVQQLEIRAREKGIHPHALVDLALEEYLDKY